MRNKIIFIFLFIFFSSLNCEFYSINRNIPYKCVIDSDPRFSTLLNLTPINDSIVHEHDRRLDSDGFKKFNIFFDNSNLEEEMKIYNLTTYKNLFIDSMEKAIETLESLLRVRIAGCYIFTDQHIKRISINYWDKTKFGTEAAIQGISTCTLDIDLIIFAKIEQFDPSTLALGAAQYVETNTRRPVVGLLYINSLVDYSKINSKEYFQSIIIHELTHVLGFSGTFFENVYHNIFKATDKFNINRTYLNSSKVIEVAKKYYNCPDVKGIELEDFGTQTTVGSHWEGRILLGDYMNGYIYPEEQVISEFTLALLEDSGFYKANYYTGGLMRYGKNKGCKFLTEQCINNSKINPFFENEFYDFFNTKSLISPSCTSGRQSRTYYALAFYKSIPKYYQYFSNSSWGGLSSADYCPVAMEIDDEINYRYFIGHCSKKGSGKYGNIIGYRENNSSNISYYKNEELEDVTGETYSNHSFCFLSSLKKKNESNINLSTNNFNFRAICYEIFCSSKSLTIKIHDNYIVCPRAGGKIQINEYEGYFLCPDYNLICSGTVLCNDMFDCVEQKSEIKNDSYNYDYIIKTTQNIERVKEEIVDEENNYELSDDGICPKYCKQCKENKGCIKCKNECGFVYNKENDTLICLPESELKIGYYKNNESIYYKCIEFYEECSNETVVKSCIDNFIFYQNYCIEEILNCETYNLNGTCKKCKEDYAFEEEQRNKCSNKTIFLDNYYTKDKGISYYLCDRGDEYIENCENCFYNEIKFQLECIKCKDGFFILDEELNKCYNETELNNSSYFNINGTHIKACSKQIEKCDECENAEKCTKCQIDYYLINNDTKKCVSISEIIPIDEYFIDKNNKVYYSCNNSEFNSIENCKKCLNENSCSLCNDGFTFINNNKSKCFKIEELENKYYPDPNDTSNYESCSKIDLNCLTCTSYNKCLSCFEGLELYKDQNQCINRSSNESFQINPKIITIFFLQIQLRGNNLLIYVISDFPIPKKSTIIAKIIIYKNQTFNILEEYQAKVKAFSTNNRYKNISEFSANLINTNQKYVEIKNFTVYSPKESNIIYKIIFDGNEDNKNTEKVEEMIKRNGVNFSKIVNIENKEIKDDNNLIIFQYKVETASEGCNFKLKTNETINSNEKIILTFKQFNNQSNIIDAECLLNSKNSNEIQCSINSEVSNRYILQDFIYYNQKEIIIITPKNKTMIYSIVCDNLDQINPIHMRKAKEKSLTPFIILISCIIFVVIIGIIYYLYQKRANKTHFKMDSINSNIFSTTQLN